MPRIARQGLGNLLRCCEPEVGNVISMGRVRMIEIQNIASEVSTVVK